MNIYFAVTQAMIDKQGMPETKKSNVFQWILNSNTLYAYVVADSTGKVLDWVKPYAKVPFAICKAEVTSTDVALAFAACLNGDGQDFKVLVTEMTWIK